ncbi:MAG: type II toxin-antitoxin system RelE/ParE family toxin [Desulfobacterales bacterium]
MKIRRTNSFNKDYRGLPSEIRNRVDKQLHYLLENPRHPSLRLKKLKGTDKFEIRVSKGYRMTFRYVDQILELRRVGTHDLLRKEGS